jgi:hypothetical protein
MKRFVMAVALTGLISVTAVAGEIPTNDFVPPPPPTSSQSTTSNTGLSVTLANVVLTIITLIER